MTLQKNWLHGGYRFKERHQTDSDALLNQKQVSACCYANLIQTISLEQGWVRKNQDQQLRLVPDPVRGWLRI